MKQNDPDYSKAFTALRQSSLFGELDESVLHELLASFRPVTWQKSETIDPEIGAKYCHFIVSGKLKITQVDPDTGRTIAPFLLSSGDIYDIFALLDGKEHTAFPIAMEKVVTLQLPLSEARACLHKHPEFNAQFLPYLGEMMRQLEQFNTSLVFHDTTTRLAELILRHTIPEKDPHDGHCEVRLINNLSHESLAEMIGSVRSVVSTQINKLKEEGIISHKRGYLAVENLEKLIQKINRLHCKKE